MNKNCFRLVFSRRLNSLVVVGENVVSAGKAASGARSGSGSAKEVAAAVTSVTSGVAYSVGAVVVALAGSVYSGHAHAQAKPVAANALPTGAQITSGSVSSAVNGATMTINQSSNKAIVNWNTFDVGSAAKVNINQPGSNAVILNRVVGNDPTQIHGQINANGQVMIVNPNGVVVGKDGAVSASGFTASSYGISDADFLAGKNKFDRSGSTAGVRIDGKIEASAGGYVVLIGAEVTNNGKISAPQGTVVMAAGESVTVPVDVAQGVNTLNATDGVTKTIGVPLSNRVRMNISAATINTAVNNTADGVIVAEGGQVLLQAAAVSDAVASVTHRGRIDTSGNVGGAVTLQADQGHIKVDGSINASSKGTTKGGDIVIGRDTKTGLLSKSTDVSQAKIESKGGFVETSGEFLKTDGVNVMASQWLLDPTDVVISNSLDSNNALAAGTFTPGGGLVSNIKAGTLSAALAFGTSITVTTLSGGAGNGDIFVNDAVTSANSGSASTLTLSAARNITVAAAITATGTKALNVTLKSNTAGAGGAILINGATIKTNGGSIVLGGAVGPAAGSSASMPVGVKLAGATLDATASAGGGDISLNGKSFNANTVAYNQIGVHLANSTVKTNGAGNVSIVGAGMATGTSVNSNGIYVESSSVSVETGTLSLNGTGSMVATGTNQVGIAIGAGSSLTSTTGAISLTGIKGASGASYGINVAGAISSSGNADVKLKTDALDLTGTINSGTGTTTIENYTAGYHVSVGITDQLVAPGILAVSSAELNKITAGTVKIGSYTAGSTTVDAATTVLASSGNLHLLSGGTLTVGTALSSTKGIFVQTSGGAITANAQVSGLNVAMDNSAGSISSTGLIGVGLAASTGADAVTINAAVTATNNLSLVGVSTNKSGIVINKDLTATNIQATGQSSSVQGPTSGIAGIRWAAGAITSTGTSVLTAIGLNSNATGYGAFDITGSVSATATTGTLSLIGNATAQTAGGIINTRGFRTEGGTTLTVAGNVTLEGNSKSDDGFLAIGNIVVNGASSVLNIKGTTEASGTSSWGVGGVGLSGNVQLNNGSALNVNGASNNRTLTLATYQETGVSVGGSITGTGGAISLTGSTTAAANSSMAAPVAVVAVSINGQITSGSGATYGKITIEGQNLSDAKTPTIVINKNINSGSNDLLIQSIGGQIVQAGSSTLIGNNVTIDNTGAGLTSLIVDATAPTALTLGALMSGGIATNGAITAGTGVSNINNAIDLRANGIQASGNINLLGNMKAGANTSTGINLVATATTTSTKNAGAINLNTNASINNNALIETTFAGGEGQTINVNASAGTLTGTGRIGSGLNPLSTLTLSTGLNSTYDGAITGKFISKEGTGVLTTRNRLFAFSQLNINNGGIQIGDGTASTTALPMALEARVVNIASGKSLTFNRADAYTNNSVMIGTGNLIQAGAGTITLSGDSKNFAGATTVNAGRTLAIGSSNSWSGFSSMGNITQIHGNLGAANSTVNLLSATSSLVFTNTASTSTVGSNIIGLGKLAQTGAGTGIVTGTNTYVGTTTVSGNTLQVGINGATGTLGAGDVTLSNGSNLNYLLTANTVMANNIYGNGNVNATITGNLQTSNPINLTTGAVNLNATGLVTDNGAITTTNGTTINGGTGVLLNSNITNSVAGAVKVHAGNGSSASTAALIANATALITQSANGGVSLVTDGQGNLTTGSILNSGTGNVELSAGQKLLAGDGSGGQVKALAGRTVSNTNGGGLLIYSGSIANSGDLTPLNAGGLTGAYSLSTYNPLMVAFNQAYGSTIVGGTTSQVIFRSGRPYSITPTPAPGPTPVPSPVPGPTPTPSPSPSPSPSPIIDPSPTPTSVTPTSTETTLPTRPTVLTSSTGTQGSVKLPAAGAVGRQFSLASADGQCDETLDEEERLRRIRNNETDDPTLVCNSTNNDGFAIGE